MAIASTSTLSSKPVLPPAPPQPAASVLSQIEIPKDLFQGIPDSNGNKRLDGKDIIAQLTKEYPSRAQEDAKLDAHVIMLSIDAKGLANRLAGSIRKTKSCSPKELQDIATEIGKRLHGQIKNYSKTDREGAKALTLQAIAKLEKENQQQQIDKDFEIYQAFTMVDFAHSAKDIFSKDKKKLDIKIVPEDVPAILKFFADSPESLTCPSRAAARQR